MATATVTFGSMDFVAGTQGQADNKRDLALVDYCKYFGLAIYQGDGVTVNPALVLPAFRDHIKAHIRESVRTQRAQVAANVVRTTELNNPVDD
jgi:hypothetical protein